MTDIFIKSYRKDFKLLAYSLKSIAKNVRGYNNIIILIPEADKTLFDTSNLPERTLVHYVKEYGEGYLFQQFCKMSAHKYCHAEYILFSDSDCIYTNPIDLKDSLKEGKPEILYTHYNKVGDAICWKECTEIFMHESVEFEFMRRIPLLYHRSTIETIFNADANLEYTIMKSGRFSEFNAIGAWAFKNEKDKYRFVNTDDWTYEPPMGVQLWSHAKKQGDELQKEEFKRTLETINKALDLNLEDL